MTNFSDKEKLIKPKLNTVIKNFDFILQFDKADHLIPNRNVPVVPEGPNTLAING
jgi:hypothetical protein